MNSGIGILVIFGVMILLLYLTKKLYLGIIGGIIATIVYFGIPLSKVVEVTSVSFSKWQTYSMLLILYAITFLQRLMERGGDIIKAQKAMDAVSGNRRINTCLSPIIMGFLPSAAIVKLCGDIVNESAGDYLDIEEKTFVASYYRHIAESFLPTYTSILLALSLSGVPTASFLTGMLPMVFVQIALGYFFYLRKMPVDTGVAPSDNKRRDVLIFLKGLWPILAIIVLILLFKIQILYAILAVEAVYIIINKVPLGSIPKMLVNAFEFKLMSNMVSIFIFRDIMSCTTIIEDMPELFSRLPFPQFLIYMLIFFIGSIVGGSNMIVSLAVPLACAAIPDGGMPLIVLLNCTAYIAMQISPTHICLEIICDHFGVSMGALIKKTMPVLVCFLFISAGYYLLLRTFAL